MKRLTLIAAMAAVVHAQPSAPTIRGFAPARVSAQRDLEARLRSIPDPARAREYMKRMAAEPHHAGSAASKRVAEYAVGLFRQWGYDARIEEFEALLPWPTVRVLEMTAPARARMRLSEPVVPHDPDSADKNQLPTYNAYAASGDVTAQVVYVNYGVPADYETLARVGVSVKGKIALARYGQSWRGTKAKTAQENGAAACLIYSDPRDDGFWQGDVFPKGPWRPAESVQRGSVMDMPLYVGDPLSPGWASEKGARKLPRDEAATLMKIPVLPISWAEAKPLLEELGGPVAPVDWRGGVPVTYHLGPGPAAARVKVDFDWTSKPVYNVVARMKGATLPDEWVIYGNHHDAWVNGAADPVSGAIALLESARAVAEASKSGWRPARTMIFALWDAEEFGLVGSTEWAEKYAKDLREKAVAYLNSDMNTGGSFSASGSPVLERFIRQVMRDVRDPASGATLLELRDDAKTGRKFRIGAPGAGSDYVAFVHHLGIPVLNLGFSGAGNQGTYHSIYDSYAWFSKHMDKDFLYAKALAQVMATSMARLAGSSLLPYEFDAVQRSVSESLDELRKQHPKLALDAARAETDKLRSHAARFEEAFDRALGRNAAAAKLAEVNREAAASERAMLRDAGLPGRPWYKHQLYAPGIYTGYSARMLPGVREAADKGRMDEANAQGRALAETLRGLNAHVESLTRALDRL